jgi:hypothetical protein
MIADLSGIVEDSTARLDQMSYQEISETFLKMGAITRRFLAAVNYRGNPALPMFPWYPQSFSSSASTGCSHAPPSSSSQPPFQVAFYPARPPAHPPFRMSPLGGSSQRSCPTQAPAQGGPGPAPRELAPAPAPVPSSSLGASFHRPLLYNTSLY